MNLRRWLPVLLMALASPGSADVLCKARNGVVVVRSACKRKETQLVPDALGLRGPQGAKGDPGPLGPGLTVHDANGALVGALLGDAVFRVIDGRPTTLAVGKSGFQGSNLFSWYAESQDCSGQALVFVPSPTTPPDPLLEPPLSVRAGVAYFAVGDASTHTVHSSLGLPSTETDCAYICSQPSASPGVGCTFIPPDRCCLTYTPGFSGEFTALTTFDLSTLGLVPPFHVEGP